MNEANEPEVNQEIARLIHEAQQAIGGRDFVKCVGACNALLDLKPEHPLALMLLGIARFEQGDRDEGIGTVSRAIKAAPTFAEAHFRLGEMLKRIGSRKKAENSFKRSLVFNPNIDAAYFHLGDLLMNAGASSEAEEAFRMAIRLNPSIIATHVMLATLLSGYSRYSEALAEYSEALRLCKAHPEQKFDQESFRQDYGLCLMNVGRHAEALDLFKYDQDPVARSYYLACLLGDENKHAEFFLHLNENRRNESKNLLVSAVSAFGAQQLEQPDPHHFCPNPLQHIHIVENLGMGSQDECQVLVDALIEQLESFEKIWEPISVSTYKGFQTNGNLLKDQKGPLEDLRKIVASQINEYLDSREGRDLILADERPRDINLHGWSVHLRTGGYESTHNHPHGWVSGVLYLQVPPPVSDPDEGSIKFTLGADYYPEVSGNCPTQIIKPSVGKLILFPSSLYHSTIPFTSDETRISLAFDLKPDVSAHQKKSQEPAGVRRAVFLKLRKTGGTSLASSVLFPYCVKHDLSYMVPSGWFAAHPRLVSGESFHMMFRHFPDYPQPWAKQWLKESIGEFQLLTMLRDPIGRVVSAFNHAAHFHGFRSFEQYWELHHEKNHQSRWLGYDGRDASFLQKNFTMVGVTERFNESMLLFRRALNMSLVDMLYIGQRRDDPKVITRDDLVAEWVDRIRESDWLDFELHEQATRLVEQLIADDQDIAEELVLYESALRDLSHPLWKERGPFSIGYAADDIWAEFTADMQFRKLRDMTA